MTKQRLFIGFHLPANIKDYLAAVAQQLQGDLPSKVVRRVKRDNMHLTLRFLGETEAELIRPMSDHLAQIATRYAPIHLTLTDLGYFPNANRPSVMWAGVQGGTAALQSMRQDVDTMLDLFGFKRDRYGLSPHLTLAYIKNQGQPRPKPLPAARSLKPLAFAFASISLIRSELKFDGPVYTDVARFELVQEPV